MAATNAAAIFDTVSGVLKRAAFADTDAEANDPNGPYQIAVGESKVLLKASLLKQVSPEQLQALTLSAAQQAANDGAGGAPVASIQHPTLFSGMLTRPYWNVAGVDYPVGVPSNIALTDWRNLSGPGITINTSTGVVRIDNTNNVTIDSVDFSLAGGAGLLINNSNGTIVQNCNFLVGTLFGPNYFADVIQLSGTSVDLTVKYCTIDADGGNNGTNGSDLIGASGNVVVQYCWLKHSPAHVVSLAASGTTLDYRFNLIEENALNATAHLNWLQWSGSGTPSVNIQFNTGLQHVQVAGGEGWQLYTNGPGTISLTNPICRCNVAMAFGPMPNPAIGIPMSYVWHGDDNGGTVTSGILQQNFFLLTGCYGYSYPSSFGASWASNDNWNLLTGRVLGTAS